MGLISLSSNAGFEQLAHTLVQRAHAQLQSGFFRNHVVGGTGMDGAHADHRAIADRHLGNAPRQVAGTDARSDGRFARSAGDGSGDVVGVVEGVEGAGLATGRNKAKIQLGSRPSPG